MNNKKKVIITGINGFLGSAISKHLNRDMDIHGLDIGAVCRVQGINEYSQMILPHADFEDLVKWFSPDYCIHCAGSSSVPLSVAHPSIDFDSGPVSTFHVLEAIRKSGLKCCTILLSSAAVYGNVAKLPIREDSVLQPISPYGYHKAMSERILEEYFKIYGLQYIIMRIFSAYGNGLRKQILWDACRKLAKQESLFLGTGEETRDFIHVDDIARLVARIIDQRIFNQTLNVGSGEQVSVKRLIQVIAENMNYPINKIRFNGEVRFGDPLRWEADISLIQKLGFTREVTLENGIQQYVDWVNQLRIR
jgi:UDP-glucose 4-epimerase